MAETHQTLARALARALDDLGTHLVLTATATGFVAPSLLNATANSSTSALNARWVYPATGTSTGQQRRVRTNGYTPSTGGVLIYPDWTAPSAGSEIDLTALFPRVSAAAAGTPGWDVDYKTITNRALARMDERDQILVTTVAGAAEYSLAAYANWLTGPDRIGTVYDPPIVAGRSARDGSWRIDRFSWDGGVPTMRLRAPWAANGEMVRIDVVRPADTLVNGIESTTGVGAETDTVIANVQIKDFLDIGLAEAYRALMLRGHDGRDWAGLYQDQEKVADATEKRLASRARGMPPEGAVLAPRPAPTSVQAVA